MEEKEAFKYCPRCGSRFNKKIKYLNCSSCGLNFYLNPRPALSVILINDNDEYLFAVRAFEPRKNYLDFLGGFVDRNEDFEEAARREIKEEAGVEVGPLTFLSTHKDEYLFQNINYQVVGITYLGELPRGSKLKADDDVSGFEYYRIDQIPMNRLAWKSMHEMVSQLKNIKG